MKKISVAQMIGRANSHLKNGELLEAEELYAEVLMSFPNNVKAQQGLRRLTGGRATSFAGTPPQKLIDHLINLVNDAKLPMVVKQAGNLLVHYPTAIILWNIFGIASAQLEQFDQAIEAFEKITTLTPNQASAYYNLGNAYKDKGRIQQAVEAYTKALEQKPNYDDAFNNLNIVLSFHNQFGGIRQTDVIEMYKKLRLSRVKNAEKYFENGIRLYKRGQLSKAISSYKKSIEELPDFQDSYYNMGVALQEQGKLEEAIAAYKKVLAIQPDVTEAYYNMGNALQNQGKLGEAIEAFKKALAIKNDQNDIYNNLGVALQKQGKLEEAIEAYNEALVIKPDFAAAHYNMGVAFQEQGKLKEAIDAYKTSLLIEPKYVDAVESISALNIQLLNTPLMISEPSARLNNFKANINKDPKFQILQALEAFLFANILQTQEHLNSYKRCAQKIISKLSEKDQKFCEAYDTFLSELIKAGNDFTDDSIKKNFIYHLGESHCLSYAHQNIHINAVEYRIVPKITLGGKAFHFSRKKNDKYKAITETNFVNLPDCSKVLISFGEIDCRPNEGFVVAARKLHTPIEMIISNTVEGYVAWFAKLNVQKKHNLQFFNVPAPVYDYSLAPELNVSIAAVVAEFNKTLAKYTKVHDFSVIDVYDFTVNKHGFSNKTYHIDRFHLGHKAISQFTSQLN